MSINILISNDDGFRAPGIQKLARSLTDIAQVTIVAPSGPRSGFSGAITSTLPLALKHRAREERLEVYSTEGTPVDCVKLALNTIFRDNPPTLVLSGVNHGSNEGICVHYSGTLGAAREGYISGIPSLAISLDDTDENPDFTETLRYTRACVELLLKQVLPQKALLSLNVPQGAVKGLKICPQSIGRFVDEYMEGENARGRKVYWMQGYQIDQTPDIPGDIYWLRQGYATLTPLTLDQTEHSMLSQLEQIAPQGL